MANLIPQPNSTRPEEDYYNLGSYRRSITTSSPSAQLWFDRGLIWSYAFNHEEAASCFEKAISNDPKCAMAYWGLAYTLGPNYNKPWEFFDEEDLEKTLQRTHRAVEKAKELATNGTEVEKALILAMSFRYPTEKVGDDYSKWNKLYAAAMGKYYERFPDDLDVATLYTDALMNLTPWALWDLKTGEAAPGAKTQLAKSVLDRAFTQENSLVHPGLLHLYIHLMEMSPSPESALPIANNLRNLVPDSGHLQHMPTHLDIICGHYQQAIASNTSAIIADQKYVSRSGALNFYTLYRAHNLHFRIYAAMFCGKSKVALETVGMLEDAIPEALLKVRSPPMADWLEGLSSVRVHVLVRFGLWDEILDLKIPEDEELFCVTTAMMHYGKGVAWAARRRDGALGQASIRRELFERSFKKVKPSRTLFNNKCTDILAIARAMLDGEIEYRRGNIETAFFHLRHAIHLDDNLPYDEPWGWMQPTRHAYGALLLEQGRVEEAAKVYAADLGVDNTLPRALRHPNNIWALQGYYECLMRLGRIDEARQIEPQLFKAVKIADVPILSSCFCRRPERIG
jgi:tetratricopeptide (TPR) repeat protein